MWLVNTAPTFQLDLGSASVGAVTLTLTRASGTVIVTGAATTDNADGTYSYTLSKANNTLLDHLRLDWLITGTTEILTTYEEITGSVLFTVEQARAFAAKADATAALKPLASTSEYPNSVITEERDRIVDDLEYWTGRSWIQRYARCEFAGTGTSVLSIRDGVCRRSDGYPLHRTGRTMDANSIISAVNGSTTVTSTTQIDPSTQTFLLTSGYWTYPAQSDPSNVTVEYSYGLPYPVDGADRIALKLLIDRLVPSAWPDRMISADTEYGTTRFVLPGGPMNNVSRIPEVNEWVTRHDHRILVG